MSTTYIRHSIDEATVEVNRHTVDQGGALLIQVVDGNAHLDLAGTPQQFLDFAAQLAAIATKAEHDRAASITQAVA